MIYLAVVLGIIATGAFGANFLTGYFPWSGDLSFRVRMLNGVAMVATAGLVLTLAKAVSG